MSTPDAADHSPSRTGRRGRHPHPGKGTVTVAWPTFALWMGGLIMFAVAAVGAISGQAPIWITILLGSVVSYVMFTVAHEAVHHALCSTRWVSAVVGRLAWVFIAPMGSLTGYRYIHLAHHRDTNDSDNDPDRFATHGPPWQMPFRWALMDFAYAVWYLRRLPARLRDPWRGSLAEVAETAVVFSLGVGGIWAAIVTKNFWTVTVLVLIPQRIAIFTMALSFDWLPHHALVHTQRENRYRASRIRVGMEWLLTPILLMQNYHLIHHLHPWLPFYRLPSAWRRNEDAYLEHGAAVSTVLGRELNPDQSRERRHAGGLLHGA